MPTYDYLCENCGHQFEELQSITAKPLRKCPKCKKNKLKRLIGAGAGLIFKGSGFYINDYQKKDSGSTKTSPSKDSKPNSSENKKSETPKSESKKSDSAKTDKKTA